jgi:hypothetical protein
MKLRSLLLASPFVVLSAVAAPASAATFQLTYSGLPFNNAAIGTGTFTIDDDALASINANPFQSPAFSALKSLSLTISGARSGNGVFTLSDFQDLIFYSPSALDFTKELIGQPLTNGRLYGDRTGVGGDFNLFAVTQTAPTGTLYFQLTTGGATGDNLAVTSIAPVAVAAVPEPASWAMMIFGMGAVGGALRRRSKVSTTVKFA